MKKAITGFGGAIHSGMISSFIIKSAVMFIRNYPMKGGAVSCSDISFKANSSTAFTNNNATAHYGDQLGGAMFVSGFSKVLYTENSSVTFFPIVHKRVREQFTAITALI